MAAPPLVASPPLRLFPRELQLPLPLRIALPAHFPRSAIYLLDGVQQPLPGLSLCGTSQGGQPVIRAPESGPGAALPPSPFAASRHPGTEAMAGRAVFRVPSGGGCGSLSSLAGASAEGGRALLDVGPRPVHAAPPLRKATAWPPNPLLRRTWQLSTHHSSSTCSVPTSQRTPHAPAQRPRSHSPYTGQRTTASFFSMTAMGQDLRRSGGRWGGHTLPASVFTSFKQV